MSVVSGVTTCVCVSATVRSGNYRMILVEDALAEVSRETREASFSGSYSAKLLSQTTMAVLDQVDHQIAVSVVSGFQRSSDGKWNDAKVTVWGTADSVGANGEQRGYFRNEHTNGDVDQGTFEAKITMSGTEVTIAGAWRFSGGTGMFAKITGNGVFNGKQTSPTDSEATWSGTYDLG